MHRIFILVSLLFFPAFLWAQEDSADLQQLQQQYEGTTASAKSSAEKVGTHVRWSQNVVPAGSSAQFAVLLDVAKGWHVNAHQPSLDYLIGTTLTLDTPRGISTSATSYPEAQELSFDFAQQPLAVYEGRVSIIATIRTDTSLSPGTYALKGNLRVQACNDAVCLAPSTIHIDIPVNITETGTGAKPINQKLFRNVGSSVNEGSITNVLSFSNRSDLASYFDRHGQLWALLGIFLIGLALNLTPCVYPMLSVTVSLFGGQSDRHNTLGRSFIMASIYVLGIIAMYSTLGFAAAYTGGLFGAWMQNSWMLAGIAILIFVLALSMFGVYELQPPQWVLQKFSGAQQATGAAGHFLSGVVVGIFAAPCVGPPVIALLAFVGSQGDPLFGFWTMFVMSLGLGFPYLILGTFSGLLSKLPQSGTWMVWVKKVFGVILIGVSLFYLAIAFFPAYSMQVIPLVLLVGGIYLALTESAGTKQGFFPYIKWGVGLVSVLLGILFINNLQKEGISWESYSPDKLKQAREANQPVMLDFYADWCVPCLEMHRITFTDSRVIEATRGFKKIKVDMTKYESKRSQKLRKEYEVMGLPTVVFLGPDGKEISEARVVGYAGPEAFLKHINKVPSP